MTDYLPLTVAAALIHRSPAWLRLRIEKGILPAERRGYVWHIARADLLAMPIQDLRGKHPRPTAAALPAPNGEWQARIARAEAARQRRLEAIRHRFPDMAYVERGQIREWILHELMPAQECGQARPTRMCWCGQEAE